MSDEIRLRRDREWVGKELEKRMALGHDLVAAVGQAPEMDTLEQRRREYYSWDEYNGTLLATSFLGPITSQYNDSIGFSWGGTLSLREERESVQRKIATKVRRLDSIRQRLDLFEGPAASDLTQAGEGSPVVARSSESTKPLRPDAVFVVHGHAEGPKEQIARWLERVGIEAVILHEQPNAGRTIMEKFSEEAGGVGYAIVVATGDDEGQLRGGSKLLPRPRQNVVLELGFFHGKLGRDRVAILLEPGVELPSDYGGVVYIELDEAGGWKLKLAQELKNARLKIDESKLLNA